MAEMGKVFNDAWAERNVGKSAALGAGYGEPPQVKKQKLIFFKVPPPLTEGSCIIYARSTSASRARMLKKFERGEFRTLFVASGFISSCWYLSLSLAECDVEFCKKSNWSRAEVEQGKARLRRTSKVKPLWYEYLPETCKYPSEWLKKVDKAPADCWVKHGQPKKIAEFPANFCQGAYERLKLYWPKRSARPERIQFAMDHFCEQFECFD